MQSPAHPRISVCYEPWGGSDGKEWTYDLRGEICKIKLFYKQAIHAIKFCCMEDGKSEWSETFGDDISKAETTTIEMKYPDEKLTYIDGTSRSLHEGGPLMITSLTFITNINRYGPFGKVAVKCMRFVLMERVITSFCGRSGDYLYAIGVNMLLGKRGAWGDESIMKKKQKIEAEKRQVHFEESMKNILGIAEKKFNAINNQVSRKSSDFTHHSTTSPLALIKSKIKAIVNGGADKLLSDEVTAEIESLYLELEKQPGCSEDDKVGAMKLELAIRLMKEFSSLGELRKTMEEQEDEYKEQYAKTDEYFTFLKRSIDIMVEVKNDERICRHGVYKSDVRVPFEFFDSSMSVLVIKLGEKAESLKKYKDQVDEMKTKVRVAFDLLESIY